MTGVWLIFIAAGVWVIAYVAEQHITPALNRIAKALEGRKP